MGHIQSSARAKSTVSVYVLRWLVDAVAASGVTRVAFLSAARVDPALLENDDARVSHAEIFRLCEVALDATGDEAFGLHWAERSVHGDFTMLSQLIAQSPTLGAGFQTLFEYQRLMSDRVSYKLTQHGARTTLRFDAQAAPTSRVSKLVVEMEAVGICGLLRWFGARVRPLEVSFSYAAPHYQAEYARAFRGVERFEQPYCGVTFASSLLSAAPPQRDEDVRLALQAIAARRVLELTQRTQSYALRVRDELVKNGRADMRQVAGALGLSVRSLRRRLDAEGETYQSIANAAAVYRAKLLLERRGSIQEVAFEMGFSDPSSFHRAFKRWTGLTPGSYLDGN
jgi:AraC-like DNA-binding protein